MKNNIINKESVHLATYLANYVAGELYDKYDNYENDYY